ncbi:hypothetical protein P7K49_021877 [Saguinus oedipus]|uniref:Uncharacterized protein n=1 Tax=Saguinus oedipus TaxID=9490 RepID=A0ABQ9UTV5_SAGOE|nr:hypothetical protein P7K49_021877 [Saguinus oedipus]
MCRQALRGDQMGFSMILSESSVFRGPRGLELNVAISQFSPSKGLFRGGRVERADFSLGGFN